ncbi:hypothetical protein HW932_01785 [Allochromatium humboldtianum]|uniref:DNA-directed DNA polymerase n=1 Tax=Allochromatium humboldtianum TaxID=504901 RepID=A0A850RAK8_9GAMM|nr:DNA polymerase [Allochromatium humboldtianum]NVZ07990.1 hypothetical protein [Allochromatium humboldtianum]
MRELCVDLETHYASDYSLKTLSSVEYVRDPRFLIHGMAVLDDGKAPFWVPGAQLQDFVAKIDWADTRLISHTYFDSLVLCDRFGVRPAEFVDTAGLARALIGGDADLARLMPLLDLGEKGDDLKETKGLRQLPMHLYDRLASYALNDVMGCWGIYRLLYPMLPDVEKKLLSLTGRISSIGVLRINHEVISAGLQELEAEQQRVIDASGVPASVLRSNQQFSAYVRDTLGLEPPTKLNEKGQEIGAFSKNDIEFNRFRAQHPELEHVWKAKLAAMSNSDIKRAQRFKNISKLGDGTLPMLQNYWGAHTGRASGGGGLNVQNLVRGSATRLCLEAPPGYQVLVADSSNIELRVNAWFAGQEDVLQVLRDGGDVYSHVASAHFGYKVTKKTHPDERQFGKLLSLGLGFSMGWKKFQTVCALGFMGAPPVRMTDEEAYQTVMTWRRNNHAIVAMWKTLGELIPTMLDENNHTVLGPVVLKHECVEMPNGTHLLYTGLKWDHETESWRYMGHHKLTPGLFDENIVQSLARHIVFEQKLQIDALDGVTVVGSTHDEVIAIAPTDRAPSAMDEMLAIMRQPPSWAPDLPLDAEGGWAQNYSK